MVFTSDGVGVVIRSVELMIQRKQCSAYDLVKTRLSESEAEAEERNQSQNVGTCIVIGLSFRFCFRLPTGRNLTPIPSRFLIFTKS